MAGSAWRRRRASAPEVQPEVINKQSDETVAAWLLGLPDVFQKRLPALAADPPTASAALPHTTQMSTLDFLSLAIGCVAFAIVPCAIYQIYIEKYFVRQHAINCR
jgi:hypothetical protein